MNCAFAPAHCTALFAVHRDPSNPLATGSRGAGWSLRAGAYARVHDSAAPRVRLNGLDRGLAVTESALASLGATHLDVEVFTEFPSGHGFGMSAAGTLAACLAATAELGLEPEAALQATHIAEVEQGAGLGDALASWQGGVEVRGKAGCPPHGWALRVPSDEQILLVWDEAPLATKSIIEDEAWSSRTRDAAEGGVDRILAAGREVAFATILQEGHKFTKELGLCNPELADWASSTGLAWGQVMLGNTLWLAGTESELQQARALVPSRWHGQIAELDENGARLVREIPERLL